MIQGAKQFCKVLIFPTPVFLTPENSKCRNDASRFASCLPLFFDRWWENERTSSQPTYVETVTGQHSRLDR